MGEVRSKIMTNKINIVWLTLWTQFILRLNYHYYKNLNYDFCLNERLICCLLIVSKVVVKFEIRDVEYGHAECAFYKY